MSSTFREELPYLVVFTGAALFLLIQMHAFDERATWIRRRIGDPSTISSLYLRGGTVFILAAMVGSLLLTTRAALEPAGGRVGPGPRPAHRGRGDARAVPARGRRRQGHGRDLRGRGQDRRQVVQRRRHRVHRDPVPRPRRRTTTSTGAPSPSTRSSSADGTRRTRAASTSRPAAQLLAGSRGRPDRGDLAQAPDHDPPRGLPRQRAAGARARRPAWTSRPRRA